MGDCLDLMKSIPDQSIDMILCDLPYGTTQNKWDCIIPVDELWSAYRRLIKPNGVVALTATPPFSAKIACENIEWFRYSWYWKKPHTGQLNAKKMPLKNVEEVLIFYQKQPIYNPQFTYSNPYTMVRRGYKGSECYGKQTDHTTVSDGRRYPMQILEFGNDKNRTHPTQKPVALMEYLIRTYTNMGGVVLDNCMGSGTTGVACMNTGRKFIGIELNSDYFNIAEHRISESSQLNT